MITSRRILISRKSGPNRHLVDEREPALAHLSPRSSWCAQVREELRKLYNIVKRRLKFESACRGLFFIDLRSLKRGGAYRKERWGRHADIEMKREA